MSDANILTPISSSPVPATSAWETFPAGPPHTLQRIPAQAASAHHQRFHADSLQPTLSPAATGTPTSRKDYKKLHSQAGTFRYPRSTLFTPLPSAVGLHQPRVADHFHTPTAHVQVGFSRFNCGFVGLTFVTGEMGNSLSEFRKKLPAVAQMFPPKATFSVDQIPDLEGRVVLVTGASRRPSELVNHYRGSLASDR